MVYLIVNPVAGNGRAARVGEKMAREMKKLGKSFVRRDTCYAGHAEELAREAVKKGAETVIAVGGDGTVFEAMQGLVGGDTALGIIPAGTGNDFVKTLRTPRKPLDALNYILNHSPRPVDAGRINDQLFLNICGTGFDISVLEYANRAKRYVRGLLPYLYGVIQTSIHYRPTNITLEVDGKPVHSGPALVCAVGNGQYYGGGLRVNPLARPDDGLLDIVLMQDVKQSKMPYYLVGLLQGKVLQFKESTHFRCRQAKMSAPGMKLNADGEILPIDSAQFGILPGALLVHW